MKYPVHVFMGSDKDMKYAEIVFSELDWFGVPYTIDTISGEKANRDCMGRVEDYDRDGRGAYLSIVGRRNVMGPAINGATYNPAVTMPVGIKDELKMDVWSSLRSPSDSPLITVIGDVKKAEDIGKNTALFMAEIMGLYDEGIRFRVCLKKGVEFRKIADQHSNSLIYEKYITEELAPDIQKNINFFADSVISDSYSKLWPRVMVSDFSADRVRLASKDNDFPIIVTPTYGSKDIRAMRKDVNRFIESGGNSVGLVLSPDNAAFAALRIMGIGDYILSKNLKKHTTKLQNQYTKVQP